jgi:hypothetical protein
VFPAPEDARTARASYGGRIELTWRDSGVRLVSAAGRNAIPSYKKNPRPDRGARPKVTQRLLDVAERLGGIAESL